MFTTTMSKINTIDTADAKSLRAKWGGWVTNESTTSKSGEDGEAKQEVSARLLVGQYGTSLQTTHWGPVFLVVGEE